MNERIRELFEEFTVPNFGFDLDISRNSQGEYINPTLEDHWQTFQEAAELIVRECAAEAHRRVCVEGNDNMIYSHLLEHLGVEE